MGLSSVTVQENALNAISTDISVIGNNLANSNTIGYQSSRALFDDLLTQAMGQTPPLESGQGVEVQTIQTQFTQGAIQNTSDPFDFAINGNGFFMLQNQNGTVDYTRNGEFSLDKNGNMVNSDGEILEGYEANAAGTISTSLTAINLASNQSIPAQATSTAAVAVNLSSNDSVPFFPWAANFSASSGPASGSYDYSTPVSVFDSAGNTHDVNIYFANTGANTWNAYAVWNEAQPGATPNYQYQQITGLTFSSSTNSSGQTVTTLNSPTTATNVTTNWDPSFGATSPQTVAISFNNSTESGSTDTTISQSTNGAAASGLTSINLNSDGTIEGTYSNGGKQTLAQVVLANFKAPTQLARVSIDLYTRTYGSGAPILATPGTGGVGGVAGSSVEESNVNETVELTNLISAQQAFSENSTVISTTNQMFTGMIADAAEGA